MFLQKNRFKCIERRTKKKNNYPLQWKYHRWHNDMGVYTQKGSRHESRQKKYSPKKERKKITKSSPNRPNKSWILCSCVQLKISASYLIWGPPFSPCNNIEEVSGIHFDILAGSLFIKATLIWKASNFL